MAFFMSKALQADVLLIVVTVLAAAGWLFSHEALLGISPLWFVAIRFSLGGLILVLWALPALRQLFWPQLRGCLWVGVWFAAGMILWIFGLSSTQHLGEGAFINSLGVVLVPIVGRIAFGERPSAWVWSAAGVALIGLVCLMAQHGLHIDPSQCWFVGAALLFSVYFQLNRHMATRVPVVALTSITLAMVGLCTTLLAAVLEPLPSSLSPLTAGWILASVMIATCLRFALQTQAQQMSTASHAALLMTLEPLWTTLLGMFFLHQPLSTLQTVGCGFIFLALLIGRMTTQTPIRT
jgi:drug/metabolite transporter (DMT)-like permease